MEKVVSAADKAGVAAKAIQPANPNTALQLENFIVRRAKAARFSRVRQSPPASYR
jgi:hypothetical protein